MTSTDPTQTALTLYSSGAWLCLLIFGAYVAVKIAAVKIAWFAAPSRAHYVAVAIGILGLIAGPASQGATPNAKMLIAAIVPSIMLLVPGAFQATTGKTPQAGRARVALLIALAVSSASMVVAVQGCSHAQVVATKSAAKSCGLSQAPVLLVLMASVLASGNVEASISSNDTLMKLGQSTLTCLAQVVLADIQAAGSDSGSGSASVTLSAATSVQGPMLSSTPAAANPVAANARAYIARHPQ